MVHLTPDELLAVLKVARARSARDWAMVLLAYRHGLRASEACDLRLPDLDLKTGSVSLRRLKGSLNTVQPLYRHKGQPLLDEVTALRSWLKERQPDGSDYLFLSQKGGRLHRSQFFRVFRACGEAADLPPRKCHPHALKHTLGTHLVAANVNLALVRQCLGHKAIGSTMKYVAVGDSQAGEAAQAALMRLY
jgi:type 1 fimbriae regulatory protein FimB